MFEIVRRIQAWNIFLVIFILPGLLLPWNVSSPSQSSVDHVSVILVVDNSGSMKSSDPQDLRCAAVQMFISLLDEGDVVGIVEFSTESRRITDGMTSLERNRDELLNKVQPCIADGFTDMKAALEDARQMVLVHAGNVENAPSVVLLTDGEPEIPSPYAGYEQEVLDTAHSLGMPIYAIALTYAADLNFLSRLTMGTGGYVIPANESTDLLDAYLQVLGTIKDRTVIGDGYAVSPGETQIEIDPALVAYVEKASFVISNPGNVTARLIAPDGHIVTPDDPQVTFAGLADPRFMVVTIAHPAGGTWKFKLAGYGNVMVRAILYSRLRAQFLSPIGFQKSGEPIPIIVRLVEERDSNQIIRIIGEAAFSAEITLPDGTLASLDLLYDDGTHGDLTAGDGDFTRLFVDTSQTGSYHITVNGWKGSVPVRHETEVRVVQFPVLIVDTPHGEFSIRDQPLRFQAHFSGGEPPTLDSGELIAHLNTPSGEVRDIELVDLNGNYSAEYLPLEDGKYTLQVETRDATYLGAKYWDAVQTEFAVHLLRELSVGQVDIKVIASCVDRNIKVVIHLPVTSLREEEMSLALEGLQDFLLQTSEFDIQPGDQQLDLVLLPMNGESPVAGEQHGQLRFGGPDDLLIQPARSIPLSFSIPSLWSRCSRTFSWAFLLVVVVTLAGISAVRRIRFSTAQPIVTGSLRYWEIGAGPTDAHEFDLTALHKSVVTLGCGADRDIAVRMGNLDDHHADFSVEKAGDSLQINLQPIGTVKKGYSILRRRAPLTHGDTFIMGGLNFQYLSDSGE